MTGRLTASLRAAPATLPALVALALFVVWSTDQAAYPLTHWAPGGLLLLALLLLTLAIVGQSWRELPRPVWIALAALAAYTALSFASIAWASVPADAWEGANRTLLYLLVFALFASWPQRGESAMLLLCFWVMAMVAVAVYSGLHLLAAGDAELRSLLPDGRLGYPSGYPNASAAQWLMAFWPAVLLAREARLHPALRGALAGGAVVLAELALLSQSRGSLYSTPVMVVLVFALLPGRTRTFALLVPVVIGIAAVAPAVLRVGDHLRAGAVVGATLHTALALTFLAAGVVGVIVTLASAAEMSPRLRAPTRARIARGIAIAACATLVLGLGGALAVAGNPVTRIRHGWDSFKSGYGSNSSGPRLVSGLGSNRYDFYRVALDEFLAHPLLGTGADNFQQAYLAHGRSQETPRYPHSVELRTLTETGLIGALLSVVGLGAALLAAGRAIRGADQLARAAAAAAAAGFAYWAVHGSFDWFFEFAGLGAPAFALLGVACSLAPRRAREPANAVVARTGGRPRVLRILAGAVLASAFALSLAAPWLSELEVQSAARIWTGAPTAAYDRLETAAGLNPFSAQPYLLAGTIALRYGALARADHEFAMALARSPADSYATLERGAIASARGERARALALLGRAVRLAPREPLAREALGVTRAGRRVDVRALDQAILLRASQTS